MTAILATAVLADRLAIVGEALGQVLKQQLHIVRWVETCDGLEDAVRRCLPDVAIVDLALPGGILGVIRQLRGEGFATRFIVTSDVASCAMEKFSIEAGADVFVAKQQSGDELIAAVEAALGGKHGVSLLRRTQHDDDFGRFQHLTRRQREVTHYLVLGYSSKRIGDELGLSPRTVQAHRAIAMSLFGVKTTVELCTRLRGVFPAFSVTLDRHPE